MNAILKSNFKKKEIIKLCLVCSSGGHFLQLYSLQEFWRQFDRFWVTFPRADTKYNLSNEKAFWAYYPTNRNIFNLIKNFIFAIKIFFKEKPNVIISTGAGVAVPFIFLAKAFGIKTIFIESLTRVETLSLSAMLIYPFVDKLLVQWPELEKKYKKARYKGRII